MQMKKTSRRTILQTVAALGAGSVASNAAARSCASSTEASAAIVLGASRCGSLYVLNGDGSDTTALWQEALSGIERAGRGAIRVTGEHLISAGLIFPDVASLDIIGEGDAVLRKTNPGREFRIFEKSKPSAPAATLRLRDLHFIGDWDLEPSMGGDEARCIAVRGYNRVVFRNLVVEAFRNMSLTADDCDEVLVENCTVLRSGRDPINLTGSRFVKVIGCTIKNSWDDAVAVHVPREVTDDTRRYATIIAYNQVLQANGIKVLGGREVTVHANQIIAPNNYGIYLGWDPYWREGNVDHRNIIIADNIVTEVIGHEYLREQGHIGAGIYMYDKGRPIYSTRITGNIITKYKPSGRGVRFSDWRLGAHDGEHRLFTADGWTDPELTYGHMGKGYGVKVVATNANDAREIAIEGNTFANLGIDVERKVED